MQTKLTKSAILAYSKALQNEGNSAAADRLSRFLEVFYGFSSRPLGDLLSIVSNIASELEQRSERAELPDIVFSLRNLEILLKETSSTNRWKDLVKLRKCLEKCESASIEQLVEAVQVLRRGKSDEDTMPVEYAAMAAKLKIALGDDGEFTPLFEQLSELDAAGVGHVTDTLMSSGSSSSKKRDLSRIRARHEALRALNAKRHAMAGRSAA